MKNEALAALATAAWRKSSYSTSTGNCVEIRHTPAALSVRDSKLDDHSTVLAVSVEHGRAFLGAVQAGRFDR